MHTDSKLTQYITVLALVTGSILLIPLIAMQFSDEVVWTFRDFIFTGTLIFGTGLIYKLVTRKSGKTSYRLAVGLALASGFILIWANGAVGIIGTESNPINLLYYAVIAVGIIGGLISRFKSDGMLLTMAVMAFGQALVAAIALIGGYYQSPPTTILEIIGVNGFFIALFVVSALLFRHVVQEKIESEKNKP